MEQNKHCKECNASLNDEEIRNHPHCFCMIAKAYPLTWRIIIKEIIDFYNQGSD